MKIYIADDHGIVRSGIRHLLTALGHEVVGEADNIQTLVEGITTVQAELLITDYDMPGGNLLSSLRKIRADNPQLKIAVLTGMRHVTAFKSVMESSIRINGLISKTLDPDNIRQALESIEAGQFYIDEAIQKLIDDADFKLTHRESQVLEFIVAGKSNAQIAEEMTVSVKTIDAHRTNLMKKLNAHNIAELIDIARKAGLI